MRYVIFDFMHMPHLFKMLDPLHSTEMIGGKPMMVNTTIPTHTIKGIFNKSSRGGFYTAVALDGTHLGGSYRKEYFRKLNEEYSVEKEYKGSRDERVDFLNAVELTQLLLQQGQVSLYRIPKLEADDLIASLIHLIRYGHGDTTTPIDIFTNDSDILPFVDDQVSVYMRSLRTYAEQGSPMATKYFQVTPNSWYEFLGGTSEHKGFYIPYNSIVLYKLIRGDKADEYSGAVDKYGAKTYSKLMAQMEADGVDFPNVFRYELDFDAVMRPVLLNYFEEGVVDYMGKIYRGINPVTSLDGQTWLYEGMPKPTMIQEGHLQLACNSLRINLVR